MAGFGATVNLTYGYGFGRAVNVSSAGFGQLINPQSGGFGETVHVPPGGFGDLVSISGCFPKSELVQTGQNERIPIGFIKTGDKLASWDVEKNKFVYTAVTKIHQHKVHEIIRLNGTMRVSSCHPLLVAENTNSGLLNLKWKAAFDISVGDCLVANDGKCTVIKSKTTHWYQDGIDVLNLSTDCGLPFAVGGFVARADNAIDNINWADTLVTKKLLSA